MLKTEHIFPNHKFDAYDFLLINKSIFASILLMFYLSWIFAGIPLLSYLSSIFAGIPLFSYLWSIFASILLMSYLSIFASIPLMSYLSSIFASILLMSYLYHQYLLAYLYCPIYHRYLLASTIWSHRAINLARNITIDIIFPRPNCLHSYSVINCDLHTDWTYHLTKLAFQL